MSATENPIKKRPTHAIWQVMGEKEKARWIRIGAVFPHRDGKGFTPIYDVFPIGGHTVIRAIKPQEAKGQ